MRFDLHLHWTGNLGHGTKDYESYGREFTLSFAGKPDLTGSAHHVFRGDRALHDPEDLLVAALSSCHMLAYLALCARRGVHVLRYCDDASGTLALERAGGGRFTDVLLRPAVTIARDSDGELARQLHDVA